MAGVLSRLRQNRGKPRFWDVAKALGFANNVVHITDFDTRPEGYKTFNGVQSYDIGASTAFDAFHKAGAVFTILTAVKPVSVTANTGLIGNRGTSNSNVGFQFYITSSGLLSVQASNGTASVINQIATAGLAIAVDTWYLLGISLDEAVGALGILWQANTVFNTDPSTYVSPSAAAATLPVAVGGASSTNIRLPSGSRMAGLIALNTAMTQQNMTDFYTLIAPRMRG